MSRFLTKRMAELPPYVPGTHAEQDDVIRLNSNESPYPPSAGVAKAVSDEMNRLNFYNDPDCTALLSAIAGLCGVKPENVMAANGSDQVLYLSFMAFAGEERPILLPDVTYGYYQDFADALGVRVKRRPLRADYTIDPQDYMERGAMVVIANPNAPTGLVLTQEDVRSICAADPGRVVLIDEAYVDFGAQSMLGLIGELENLLITRTFSKSGSLAGARLGYALGCETIIEELSSVRSAVDLYGVSRMAQAAGIAACREWNYYRENCRRVMEARDWALVELRSMGCRIDYSFGNFLFVQPPMDAKRLQTELGNRGILVRHWNAPRLSDRLRITVGTMKDMQILCTCVRDILKENKS